MNAKRAKKLRKILNETKELSSHITPYSLVQGSRYVTKLDTLSGLDTDPNGVLIQVRRTELIETKAINHPESYRGIYIKLKKQLAESVKK